ncbi:hypothetical protein [Hymenobacter rubidus]|uniref:hypothetical protein n=1 Tax=Hymenobacter rubidus TaxID=1441626 RepID=UPI00191D36FE|nr:hypothetical protein [Hymenobacter rubidus]
MNPFDPSGDLDDDGTPNLPLVTVRGVKDADVWRCFERYNLQFNPPSDTERKLVEVIVALEEMVTDQETTITRLRKRPAAE